MAKKIELNSVQREILDTAEYEFSLFSEEEFLNMASGRIQVEEIDDERLVEFLELANMLYRGGAPIIPDNIYDHIFLAELARRDPENQFLQEVEPEPAFEAKTVELPVRMLSTDKAYDFEAIERWAGRIEKAAAELGVAFADMIFRVTPKLDGYAAFDNGTSLYTRGDGRRGTDITRAFDRGLRVAGDGPRAQGAGEVVVSKSYFQEHLAAHFDNSRNFQASLIKEKELEKPAARAIEAGAAVFFPFAALPDWLGTWGELADNFEQVVDTLWHKLDYDVDGVVLEVLDEQVREHMGATRHHHRWQIAFKRNTEMAEVKVLQVIAQTSRSGRVNPVAEVEPTRLSGAMIRRATAHHYNMVRQKGIGPGAVIRLSRSGEVIPKIEEVLVPAEVQLPERCPSCGSELFWEGEYLQCINNMNCPAQITTAIEHFFRTLGNVDGFGPASVQKLYEAGIQSVPEIYKLEADDFERFGFGPKQSENMVLQLQRSRTEAIEDWRFLAAFGIYRMGLGNCERLLSVYPLGRVFSLTLDELVAIKGFSGKSGQEMLAGMEKVQELFNELYNMGFNLIPTEIVSEEDTTGDGILAGRLIVFTGTMQSGSRNDMKKNAKLLGAKIGDSITGKTDLLVCGEKVGAAKLAKAEKLGVKIVSESEYLQMLQ